MPLILPSTYRHTQTTLSNTWTIVHNLGGNGSQSIPIVDTLIEIDGDLVKVIPRRIEIIDANTVEVTFSQAQIGQAIIVI